MYRSLETLVRTYFTAFDNRDGATIKLDELRPLFAPGAVIVKSSTQTSEVMTVSQFLEPRQTLLTDGSLTDFHEWEIDASTFMFGGIACRTMRYGKKGRLNGVPFSGEGRKSMHFTRIDRQWRITSILWQDADPRLSIDSAHWLGMAIT